MSKMVRYLNSLPADVLASGCVTKTVRARDLILCLPDPAGGRSAETIPEVNIIFHQATSDSMPPHVKDKIRASPDEEILGERNLMGLSMAGLGMPPEIYIQTKILFEMDDTGQKFEEIIWHEILHAIEGIRPDGTLRDRPWSFDLQNRMVKMDDAPSAEEFISSLDISQDAKKYIRYLRRGTDAQENVSEIFARVGVLFLKHIRQTGAAPDVTKKDFLTKRMLSRSFNDRAADCDLVDLRLGLGTFGDKSHKLFWREMPEMVARISGLYGCRPDA